MDEGEVERPEGELQERVRRAEEHGRREGDAGQARCAEHPVGGREPEERGLAPVGGCAQARVLERQEVPDGQEAAGAEERVELQREGPERREVHEAEEPEDGEARQLVRLRALGAREALPPGRPETGMLFAHRPAVVQAVASGAVMVRSRA